MAAPVLPLPLREGDRLSREEFLRRWELLPDLKHAELIDGVVYLASPVSAKHQLSNLDFGAWLRFYAAHTPGCVAGADGTWLMGRDAPQPDLAMTRSPKLEGELMSGAPELAIEITASSQRKDLGPKAEIYRRAGVREYITVLVHQQKLIWRELSGGAWREIEPDADGIHRSRVFPGLWLDAEAMWRGDFKAVLATLQRGLDSRDPV